MATATELAPVVVFVFDVHQVGPIAECAHERDREPIARRFAEAARASKPDEVEREFFDLFIGIGRGEMMPYGSYYLTGFLHERPLARLRTDLAELGIARSDGNHEPEDHIGTLCEVMAGLAGGEFPAPRGSDEQIFKKHIEPWAARFFTDLERAQAAQFYRSVGMLGRTFIEIESEAYALPA